MNWKTFAVGCCLLAWLGSPAMVSRGADAGQATSKPSIANNEVRAETAFTNGQYALALPLFQKVLDQYKDQPDKLAAVQEKIRVCQKQLAAAPPDPSAAVAAPTTAPTAEARKPHPAPKAGVVYDVIIKDLGNFEYDPEKGGGIPADVKRLSGSLLRTRGFMIPLDQAENITEFALVPSLFACCFGQPPQIQHTLVVHCPKGKAVTYCPDEISVEGTLKVEERKDDGYVVSVFEIDARSVKPAPK